MSKDNEDVNDIKNNELVAAPPVKQKNPNRVAVGKKLSENNRLQKERYNKLILEKQEKERVVGDVVSDHGTAAGTIKEDSNAVYYVIGACVWGGIGYYCYNNCNNNNHKEVKVVKPKPSQIPVKTPLTQSSRKIEW